jgi:hypothetical protein
MPRGSEGIRGIDSGGPSDGAWGAARECEGVEGGGGPGAGAAPWGHGDDAWSDAGPRMEPDMGDVTHRWGRDSSVGT